MPAMTNVPPGLPTDNISRLIVDGGAHDQNWDTYTEVRHYTNAFVWDEKDARVSWQLVMHSTLLQSIHKDQ